MPSLNTRKAIRRRIGRLAGDMTLLVATGSGTTTTFVDEINLNREANTLINRLCIFSGGTAGNLGEIVRISGNDKSAKSITFTPAVSDATAADDELEMWNQRDQGVSPRDVNDLINDAIVDVGEQSVVPVLGDITAFSRDNPEVSVNAAWEALTGVDWEDDAGIWHPIPPADLRVDRIQRHIEILNRSRELADAHNIRVRGANTPDALSSDSSTTSVNFEWITHHVAAQCLEMRMDKTSSPKELEGRLVKMQMKAEMLRPKTALRLKGRYWRLT